eukprot:scaffold10918_cov92-Amphora_coffeaeformis.AAC.1
MFYYEFKGEIVWAVVANSTLFAVQLWKSLAQLVIRNLLRESCLGKGYLQTLKACCGMVRV